MYLWVIQMNTTVTLHIETWNEEGAEAVHVQINAYATDSVYQLIYQIA